MDLTSIVSELKTLAKEYPVILSPDKIVPPHERHAKEFTYKGFPLRIIYTVTPAVNKNMCILSMRDRTGMVLPDYIVKEIRDYFFGESALELPDSPLHPPKVVRKFMEIENAY